jgi:hypothetical protein
MALSRRDRLIVAWPKCLGQRHPKEASRRVRCDSCRGAARRFDDWSDKILNPKTENIRGSPLNGAQCKAVPLAHPNAKEQLKIQYDLTCQGMSLKNMPGCFELDPRSIWIIVFCFRRANVLLRS